jgi:type 1 glutamine amidotransferase
VDVARTAPKGVDPNFKPDFTRYKVVLTNYNGDDWPLSTRESFVSYVRAGGGVVVVHAANNAFGNWKEYNEIIGLGGWGGRSEKSGPYVYFKNAQLVRDTAAGKGGAHGKQHPFKITLRDAEHPIVKGLPAEFMHEKDELYDRLRGPATKMAVLGTAFADPAQGGTGRDEPMILALEPFSKGRVYHTPMGHGDYSQMCVAYITLLQRGTQWAATGQVTIPVPADFPTADKVSVRAIDIDKLPEPTPVK